MKKFTLIPFLIFCVASVTHAEPTKPGHLSIELLEKIPSRVAPKEPETGYAAGPWNGKSAAIVLSYDDGLNVHLDTVVPLLNQHKFNATFFVTGTAIGVRSDDWKSAAEDGHELGNHTMIHPCSAGLPGREWVKPEKDLDRYSYNQFSNEVAQANALLGSIDNKNRRSFAYPCGDKNVGGDSIVDVIKNATVAARTVSRGINVPGKIDLYDLLAYSVSGHDAETLQAQVEKAVENNGLLIFLFHGVGGEHDLNIDHDEHQKFIEYLSGRKNDFWLAPLIDVADYMIDNGLHE